VVQRSHGWELRADEVLDGWRRRWQQPEKPFPAILPTLLLRRLLSRHNRLATRWCDGTIVYCTLCRDYIIERHRVAPERVAVIAAASTDDALQQPLPPRTEEARQHVLYVSQFAFFKAPALVAEAIQQLAQRFPHAHFTWVCDTQHHPEVRARLGAVAQRCRLLGWMSQQQLCDVYDAHGIFLFPSLYEGFGKVFLEAMSRGLCVVGSDEGGMRDVLRHGDNGMIVPPGNSAALVEATARLISDPALFRRVGAAARRTALEYTWRRAAQETVAFYEQLAEFKQRDRAARPAFGSR
jgi:glycosyltransferase involved in cell wall biosynthesis